MTPEERLTKDLAARATAVIVSRTIRALQATDSASWGAPHLRTIWDDICIQVQGVESVNWDEYVEAIELEVAAQYQRLPAIERAAIRLQSSAGMDWSCGTTSNQAIENFVSTWDVTPELSAAVISKASEWSNAAVRRQTLADERGRYGDESR